MSKWSLDFWQWVCWHQEDIEYWQTVYPTDLGDDATGLQIAKNTAHDIVKCNPLSNKSSILMTAMEQCLCQEKMWYVSGQMRDVDDQACLLLVQHYMPGI